MIYSDRILSQKLERVEARSNAAFVETRARLFPDSGAAWTEIGGAYAMFDGVESPCTQTFGLGLFDQITEDGFTEIEQFFASRGAPVFHEVSPMADPAVMPMLNARGYNPIELSSVLYRSLNARRLEVPRENDLLSTRFIEPDEVDLWAATSAAGWATEHEGFAEFMFNFGQISAQCEGAFPYIAELGGKAISTALLFIHDEVAMLAGASTIPEGRNHGAQNALLASRLKFAAAKGCTLAAMATSPGGQSQKNAQKN